MEDELEEEMMKKEHEFEMACSGQQPLKSSRKKSEGDTVKKVKFDDQVSVKSIDQVENEVQVEEPSSSAKAEEAAFEEEEDTDSEKEFETGERCTKKRTHYTNDELFYDPNRDEKDQDWINARRKTQVQVLDVHVCQAVLSTSLHLVDASKKPIRPALSNRRHLPPQLKLERVQPTNVDSTSPRQTPF